MKNFSKFLLSFCVILLTSCVSMDRNLKALKRDTWTGRFANMFYSINKNEPNTIHTKIPSKRQLKLLQKDMNFIVAQIRKNEKILTQTFNKQPIPKLKVTVVNDEFPNMAAICSENKVKITTGLVRIIFSKAFEMNFSEEKLLSFSSLTENSANGSPDNKVAAFLNILYNGKLKRLNLLSGDLDDPGFDSMSTLSSLQQTISFSDSELIKILVFLVSHEFYHLSTNCVLCDNSNKKIEIEADEYAALQYYYLNRSNAVIESFFPDFTGRTLPEIFKAIYTDVEIPDPCYLPIEERVRVLDSTLTNFTGN